VRVILFAAVLCLPAAALARPKAADKLHQKAVKLYELGKYKEAARLFADELASLEAKELGTAVEQGVREQLVLALFSAGDKARARAEYATLHERFPSFRFDPDRVFPDAIAFFEPPPRAPEREVPVKTTPPPETPPPPADLKAVPAEPPAAPERPASTEAPREITVVPPPPPAPPTRSWHWYYLTPLGIGQFLAGSPVRGAVLLVLELGFIAMNAVGYALLQSQRRGTNVASVPKAEQARALMDVGFFGMLGASAFGIVDGAALEP
jgi:hypothetical protein